MNAQTLETLAEKAWNWLLNEAADRLGETEFEIVMGLHLLIAAPSERQPETLVRLVDALAKVGAL